MFMQRTAVVDNSAHIDSTKTTARDDDRSAAIATVLSRRNSLQESTDPSTAYGHRLRMLDQGASAIVMPVVVNLHNMEDNTVNAQGSIGTSMFNVLYSCHE